MHGKAFESLPCSGYSTPFYSGISTPLEPLTPFAAGDPADPGAPGGAAGPLGIKAVQGNGEDVSGSTAGDDSNEVCSGLLTAQASAAGSLASLQQVMSSNDLTNLTYQDECMPQEITADIMVSYMDPRAWHHGFMGTRRLRPCVSQLADSMRCAL